jgi:hypothetical protein
MKLIELTPEWVLNELPISCYADGNGNISIETDRATDASWIKLALNTLCITYKENDYGDIDTTFYGFDFKIIDIKEECPSLYISMKEMDNNNKNYKNLSKN